MGAVEGGNFLEFTGSLDTAVFREEDGDRVVAECLNLLLPCGGLVGGGIAPRIVVEREEVAALVVGTAVHVVGGLDTVVIDISGGVANRDLAVFAVANVLLQVTSDGFDVWCRVGRLNAVDDFVSGEEKQSVTVGLEYIDRGEETLKIFGVV